MKILDRKDAMNRRLYNNQSFVETAIHRVSCLNRTVLPTLLRFRLVKTQTIAANVARSIRNA
ncbi:MAG: hypothetical protein V7K69_25055 [Nostoc sp.]|uniref:hypothetical protein n=1 Tax=Nostoc sp. TaxID=1180 RepID=UPI002FF8B59C